MTNRAYSCCGGSGTQAEGYRRSNLIPQELVKHGHTGSDVTCSDVIGYRWPKSSSLPCIDTCFKHGNAEGIPILSTKGVRVTIRTDKNLLTFSSANKNETKIVGKDNLKRHPSKMVDLLHGRVIRCAHLNCSILIYSTVFCGHTHKACLSDSV